MAHRLFVVISLHICFYHVVQPSNFVSFATSEGTKQINLDIRSFYAGLPSTTGFASPYGPNIESAPGLLNQVIPSQIVSTEPLSSTTGSILPNPGLSNYQTSPPWTKSPGFCSGGFIRGFFKAADYGRGLSSPGLPIGLGPATGCTNGVSESGRSNFHESICNDGSGSNFRLYSGYRNRKDYDDLVSDRSESTRYYGLESRLGESVSSNCRSGSNFVGSYCNLDASTNSYSGLGSNCESGSSKTKLGSIFDRPYINCDVSTCRNSGLGLGRNVGELVSSKGPQQSKNLGLYSYGLKHHHGSTNSNEYNSNDTTNSSGRKGSSGESDHGAMAVTGEVSVLGRTAVVGRVPITGGVKFNGFIPAAGRVTIGGSCHCGPPFAF